MEIQFVGFSGISIKTTTSSKKNNLAPLKFLLDKKNKIKNPGIESFQFNLMLLFNLYVRSHKRIMPYDACCLGLSLIFY